MKREFEESKVEVLALENDIITTSDRPAGADTGNSNGDGPNMP